MSKTLVKYQKSIAQLSVDIPRAVRERGTEWNDYLRENVDYAVDAANEWENGFHSWTNENTAYLKEANKTADKQLKDWKETTADLRKFAEDDVNSYFKRKNTSSDRRVHEEDPPAYRVPPRTARDVHSTTNETSTSVENMTKMGRKAVDNWKCNTAKLRQTAQGPMSDSLLNGNNILLQLQKNLVPLVCCVVLLIIVMLLLPLGI